MSDLTTWFHASPVFQIDHPEIDAVDGRENGRPAAKPSAPKSAVSLQLLYFPAASPDVLPPLMSEFEEEGEAITDFLSDSHIFGYIREASQEHGRKTDFFVSGLI